MEHPTPPPRISSGFDLRRAWRAVRALIADPDDTSQAFRVVDALPGNAPKRNLRRFSRTELGARVLAERSVLMHVLADRPRLESLPEGSLGRAYLAFMDAESITADGLVDASIEGRNDASASAPEVRDDVGSSARADHEVFDGWLRDSHDLWHTVTGYQGDLVGEASLLAFSFAQTRHPGVGLIVAAALARTTWLGRFLGPKAAEDSPSTPAEIQRQIIRGFVRGVRAEWLAATDWESLLERPLAEVRDALSVDEPPAYTPIRTIAAAA